MSMVTESRACPSCRPRTRWRVSSRREVDGDPVSPPAGTQGPSGPHAPTPSCSERGRAAATHRRGRGRASRLCSGTACTARIRWASWSKKRTVPRIRAQASLEDPCPRWAPLTCSPPPQVLQLCLPGSQGPTLRLGARSPRPGRLVKAGEAGRGGPHTAWPRPSASPWRLSTAWPSLPSDGQLPVDPLVGVSPVSGDGPSPEESRVGQGQGKPALAFRMPWCHLTQGGLSEPQATLSMALGRPWQGHDSDLQVLQMHLSRQITWIPDSDPPGSHRVHSLTTEH